MEDAQLLFIIRSSGHWQVTVKVTRAFVKPYGLYHFKVMPFGLCNALCMQLHYNS